MEFLDILHSMQARNALSSLDPDGARDTFIAPTDPERTPAQSDNLDDGYATYEHIGVTQ